MSKTSKRELVDVATVSGVLKTWLKDWGGALTVLSAVYTSVFVLWITFKWGGADYAAIINNFAFLPIAAAAIALAWRVSTHPALDAQTRRSWRIVSLAYISLLLGRILLLAYENILGIAPFPSLADLFFIAYYPLLMLGMLLFPVPKRTRVGRVKFWLDAGTVMLGGGMLVWYFFLGPTILAEYNSPLERILSAAYPIGDMALLFGVTALLLKKPASVSRFALQLLVAAFLSYFVADVMFGTLSLQGSYKSGDLPDAFWMVSGFLIIATAQYQYWQSSHKSAGTKASSEAQDIQGFSPLPYLAVGAGYALLLSVVGDNWSGPLGGIVVGAVVLTALVITRQIIAIRENGRLLSERAIHKSEARFHALVQNSADLITLLGADGTILYQSPSFERLLGLELQTTFRSDIASMLHPDDLGKMETFFAKVISMPGGNVTTEMRVQRADGAWVNLEAIGSNLLDDPNIQGIVLNSRDITARNILQEELKHQAYYEILTGLPNRAFFMEQLQRASEQTARSSRGFAVMFMDLDNFKVINDSLGHRAGDNMLIALSKRILGCVRPMDTVARLGGDEFTILLEGTADVSDATLVAERVLDLFKKPFSIEGQTLFVSASIGIALSAPGADSPDDILRNADIALYQAKSKGKSRYAIFADGMNTQATSRLRLETELRYAIEREEFVVYYQPVVDLKTGRISEVEALVRWQHPERGLVPPLEFIPTAEETGMIIPIGQWVLEQACRQVRAWQVQYPSDLPLALSVNLSARQFQHPHLVEDITHTLHDCGLELGCLKLEITESATMEDSQLALKTLGELKNLGIKLAIDDFGTGYSTLSYLKLYPVDTLKIDRSFVREIGRSPGDTAIVRAAIAFAKAMNLTVTAEGIETADQLQQLEKQACDYGQGYYFSRPIPGQELSALLAVPPEWKSKNRASLPPVTPSHGAAVAVPLLPNGSLAA